MDWSLTDTSGPHESTSYTITYCENTARVHNNFCSAVMNTVKQLSCSALLNKTISTVPPKKSFPPALCLDISTYWGTKSGGGFWFVMSHSRGVTTYKNSNGLHVKENSNQFPVIFSHLMNKNVFCKENYNPLIILFVHSGGFLLSSGWIIKI